MAGDRTTRIHAVSATTKPEAAVHHATPRETAKILGDCRDLAISRLTTSFAQMMDRVGELLMDRANKSDVREEQQLYLDARHALKGERPALMAEFERQLRRTINDRIAGKTRRQGRLFQGGRGQSDAGRNLVDGRVGPARATSRAIVENLSHDELLTLNRGLGFLLGRPDLGTDANPHFARRPSSTRSPKR